MGTYLHHDLDKELLDLLLLQLLWCELVEHIHVGDHKLKVHFPLEDDPVPTHYQANRMLDSLRREMVTY